MDADKDLIKQQEQDKAKLEDSEADLNDKLKEVQAALAKLETMQKDLDKQLNEKTSFSTKQKQAKRKRLKRFLN